MAQAVIFVIGASTFSKSSYILPYLFSYYFQFGIVDELEFSDILSANYF